MSDDFEIQPNTLNGLFERNKDIDCFQSEMVWADRLILWPWFTEIQQS